MTNAPPVFGSVVAPQKVRGHFAWASLGALSLHAGILALALSMPGREMPPTVVEKPRLSVTLLDAPQTGVRRSEGLAGGQGQVVLGAALGSAQGVDNGRKGTRAEAKAAKRATSKSTQPARSPGLVVSEQKGAAETSKPAEQPLPVDPSSKVSATPIASATPAASTSAAVGAMATGAPNAGGSGTGVAGESSREGLGKGTGRGLSPDPVSGDTTVLAFGDGMKHPKLLSKVDPVFTKEARDAHAQGLILTKCVITKEGRLRDCQIVKGIPLMDAQVLAALRQWRYEPVMYRNQPVSVRYLIPVRLQ